MGTYIDPSINRKSNIVDDSFAMASIGVPLPSVVEVSESGTCNRRCAFCPRSDPGFPDIKAFVEVDLIEKLSSQLAEAGFRGIFLFSGFVEPLLDRRIYDLVGRVRKNLPQSRIELVTNGDVLNERRLRKLFGAGLDTLLISVYDGPEHAERFQTMCENIGLRRDQFVVRHRYLPPEDDFGITLSNRAGLMENAEFAIPAVAEPVREPCHYPHYTFFMDYQGDVLLCPHDWGKKRVVGNMNGQDFMEIWTGPGFASARRQLANGNRCFAPCDVCDVKGGLMGSHHVRAWQSLEEHDDPPTEARVVKA